MIKFFILLWAFISLLSMNVVSVPAAAVASHKVAHVVTVTPIPTVVINTGLSVIDVEDDVIMGNHLPRYGVLCQDTVVRGAPMESQDYEYILSKGTVVDLIEQSRGQDRSWVMIKSADWIQLNKLCAFQN
jgi:hypothetical protein